MRHARPCLRVLAVVAALAAPTLVLAKHAADGGQPGVTVTTSGSALAKRVAAAIQAVDLAPAANLHVEDKAGVITVSGWTATLAARDAAARAVEGTPGVRFSQPDLVARPTSKVSDDAVKERAQKALQGDKAFQGPALVDVAVSKGVAKLTGTVHQPDDKYLAESLVAGVDGVVGIDNAIAVDPVAGGRRMEVELAQLLQEGSIPVDNLSVSSDGSTVVINGTTHDVRAKAVIQSYTEQMAGGKKVVNAVRYLVTPQAQR